MKDLRSRIRNPELRVAFIKLGETIADNRENTAELMLEYLMGLRVFKRHTEALGVHFRLDTTESKTIALHDLITLSSELNIFQEMYLFLDELEKHGIAFEEKIEEL